MTKHVIHHYRLLNLELTRLHSRLFKGTPMERGVGKMTTLMLVGKNPGLTQASIAKSVSKDGAAMTRIIDELVREGLIQRGPSAERRAHSLMITPEGKRQLEAYMEISIRCEREFTEGLTAAEKEQALHILRKLRRIHSPEAQGLD